MADVVLNLIYNDNGAGKNVDNLVRELQKLEQHPVQVRINTASLRESAQELSKLTASFEKLKTAAVGFNNPFDRRTIAQSFSDAEKNLSNYEHRIESTRRRIQDLFIGTLAKKKLGLFDPSDESNIKSFNESLKTLTQDYKVAKESAKIARLDLERIGAQIDISGAKKSILELAQELENLSKYGTTNVRQDEAVGRRVSAMLGLSALPSSATTESPQSPRGSYSRYLDYSGLSSHFAEEERRRVEEQNREQERLLAEQKEKIERSNAEIALGYHQTWRGIQQVVTGAINSLQSVYNTWKSTVEAPLNLTGVSSLASMLESMEGSLLLNQISSNITTGFSEGVERYDILMSFPAVMENIGYSTDQATAAMDRLYQSVLGLPTSFGDIVQNTQFFTLVLDDLEKATDLAIAANNAFVASGADSQQVSSGMRQLQYILEGTKLRSTQWYSLIRSMPLALREVGDALGYPDFNSFTADLMAGSIASEDLIDTLIDVGLNSEKLGGIIDVMKSRIQAALDNVTNAGKRMGETLVKTLDDVLTREGGKGITENIKGVSDVIDHITAVAAQWINDHGAEIQALIDRFFDIDWASVVPEFLQGLVNIANKALDNIGTWIQDIGGIIEKVGTLFNDIENSQTLKVISGIVGGIGSIAQIFTGISNIRLGSALIKGGSAAGGSLAGAIASWFSGSTASAAGGAVSSGISIGSFLGYTSLGILVGALTVYLAKVAYDWADGIGSKVAEAIMSTLPSALDSAFGFVGGMMQVARENRLPQRYLRMQLYSGRISDFAERYGEYNFADSGSMMFLNTLSQYLSNFEIPAQWGDQINESFSKLSSDLNLIDVISKPYDDAIAKLDGYKTELLKRIDEINEEIAKRFAGAEINTYSFYEKIYNNGKKFLSEQYEEASGWSYSNTTKDRADTLEKLLPEATSTLNEITEYALANYSDDEGVMAVVAQFMADFDYNDPEALAVLVKNYGGKDMQTVFEQYFEQQARNLDLDEAFRTALLQNEKKLTEQEVEGINIAQNELEEQKQTAIAPYVEQLETDIDALESDFDVALKLVEYKGGKLIDVINNLFNSLDSSGALDDLNDFFDVIERSMRTRLTILTGLFRRSFNFSSPSPAVQTEPYATGGFAPMGTDTVPAMLTPGEYVQRRAAVEHFGRQFMERINNLDLRGALRSISMNYATPYATGGFVRSDNRSYRDNHATVNQIFKSANASTGFRRASRFVRALG